MTRGRCGSLLLHRGGLSPPVSCRSPDAPKPHPEQGFRACLGILRLVRSYGAERVEAACQRGIDIGARTYGSVVSILRNNLDRAYRPQPVPDAPSVQHGNIRGGSYYH